MIRRRTSKKDLNKQCSDSKDTEFDPFIGLESEQGDTTSADTITGTGYSALMARFHHFIRPHHEDSQQRTLFVWGDGAEDYLLTVETVYVSPEIPRAIQVDTAFRYHLDEVEAENLLCVIQEPFKRTKRDVCALTGDGVVWWEAQRHQTYRMGYGALRRCEVESQGKHLGLRLVDYRDTSGFWIPLALHEAIIQALARFIGTAGAFIKKRQVNLHGATAQELSQLPGITPEDIQRLLELRNIGFKGFDDFGTLANELHWSPAKRQRVFPWILTLSDTLKPAVPPEENANGSNVFKKAGSKNTGAQKPRGRKIDF